MNVKTWVALTILEAIVTSLVGLAGAHLGSIRLPSAIIRPLAVVLIIAGSKPLKNW